MKHPIGQTSNGISVYVDLIFSEAAGQISYEPRLIRLIEEVLTSKAFRDEFVSIEHDMGRSIGYDFVVETTEKDTVFYAQPLRDDVFTRFVKNSKPVSTQHVTLVLHRDDKGAYELDNTWIGRNHPPRPGSTDETPDSESFWANHAVVFNQQPVQSRSITKERPYTKEEADDVQRPITA